MNRATWAERYVERLKSALTPLNGKTPIREAWPDNLITTPEEARNYWTRYPHHNIGACLGPSGLCSLDADNEEWTRRVLAAEGIELDQLIALYPTIVGRSPRIEFSVPPGIELNRKSFVLPPESPGEKPITVFELRAGRVQDVLPPSTHPDTQQPYRWVTPPRNGFLPLPDSLLRLWKDFDAFKRRARNLCPWAGPETEPAPASARRTTPYTGPSVIAEFNAAHDSVSILEAHGYVRAGKRRWKSPHGKNMAGIVLLPDGKVYSHHVSDPLGDKKPHDTFDLYVQLQHGGDFRSAVKAAAELLGLNRVNA